MNTPEKPVGLTRDAGWQFGLRKTFPFSQKYLWDFLFSDQGLKLWLGELEQALSTEHPYRTQQGVEGRVRAFNPYSHIRMTWKKKEWQNFSTVQVRVMGSNEKAVISFHQEKMADSTQREEMKEYWNQKMKEIEAALIPFK